VWFVVTIKYGLTGSFAQPVLMLSMVRFVCCRPIQVLSLFFTRAVSVVSYARIEVHWLFVQHCVGSVQAGKHVFEQVSLLFHMLQWKSAGLYAGGAV
jgi:hypothetical protein